MKTPNVLPRFGLKAQSEVVLIKSEKLEGK